MYYSAFYALSALLLYKDIKVTTHAGAKNQLSLHFIKTGMLSPEYGKIYMTLFENRQSGDYEDFVYCDNNLFNELLPDTEKFIEAVIRLIN